MTSKNLKKKTNSKGPGRLSAEETEKISDRLLDAAMTLFTTDGFERTSMERIAKAAGASTKTIYSRYSNKAEILKEVVERLIARNIGIIASGFPPDMAKIDPRVFLLSLGKQISVPLAGEGAGINRLAMAEAINYPELANAYVSIVGSRVKMLAQAMTAWANAGYIKPVADPETTAWICISLLTDRVRILGVLGTPMKPADVDTYLNCAVDIFLKGLGYKAKE